MMFGEKVSQITNTVAPDQHAHYEQFDQGIHDLSQFVYLNSKCK